MHTTKNDTAGKRHAQRHAFALASRLKYQFNQRGISAADFWNAIKLDLGVESRSEIDELGYVRLAARLEAAKRHGQMFDALCRKIKEK